MTDASLRFDDMPYTRPDLDAAGARIATLIEQFGDPAADAEQTLQDWQTLDVELNTLGSLARIRWHQDSRIPERIVEHDWWDEQRPTVREHYVDCARALLEGPHCAAIAERHGEHFIAILRSAIAGFDPAIKDAMAAASKATTAYTKLLASAKIEFDGKTLNLSGLAPYYENPDRAVRRAAQEARGLFAEEHTELLDQLFDDVVGLRDQMGRALGFDGFTPLGYQWMTRTDYGPDEVARFRAQVLEHVVPLATELRAEQARAIGLDRLKFHDEALRSREGNPRPQGDDDWVIARCQEMYASMDPQLGEFFETLLDRGLMDLSTRAGKAGGGFCASLGKYKVPFIYANFNGTTNDVRVMTHECGHAFQGWMSRDLYPHEYGWPTAEACEIHSMALEYLTWPSMGSFFGEADAIRFCRNHLTTGLQFLPYACAVDEFQHWVYANPNATPGERKRQWQQLERTYLPHRDYDGLPHLAGGGLWQFQRHIYNWPFYYIDYALALTGAFQFWHRASQDREAALADYIALCEQGGSQSYLGLLKSANLASPFDDALADVVETARAWLAAHPV